jgi:hypothetical protein
MGRKVATVVIQAEGRDKGKVFKITEMFADAGEDWELRALGAAARAGQDIPDNLLSAGWAAITFAAMRAIMGAPFEEVRPLLAEMMACVQIVLPAVPDGRDLIPDDIEEIATRAYLRDEVFKLHANFSVLATIRLVISAFGGLDLGSNSSLTLTSQGQSDSLSATDSQASTS